MHTDSSVSPEQQSAAVTLEEVAAGVVVEVVSIEGDDALATQLLASGLWPGARIERIVSAPFGGPVLFRLHGYRLALRRAEAARVTVRELAE